MSKKSLSIDNLNYEQAFSELEDIIQSLEEGTASLEESLAHFERGQLLAQYCSKLLENAELKVRQLSQQEILPDEKD